MNIIIDECVDRRLAYDLSGHNVKTVYDMGWSGIVNGKLLALASEQFEIFITVDRNLSFQQSLLQFDIAVILLHVPSNRLADLKPLVPKILSLLPEAVVVKINRIGI